MQFKITKVLSAIFLLYSISATAQNNANNNISNNKIYFVSDSQKQIDILHYDLNLNIYPDVKLLSGTALITAIKNPDLEIISKLKPEPELELNLFDNLEVLDVTINCQKAEYTRKKNRIFINTKYDLTDTFNIEIKYKGTPQRGGFDGFVFGEVNGNSLIYNISEPNFASTWFPCDDDPSDKAMLDIRITNDSQYVSVSNGNLINIGANGSRKTYYYQTIYPISTYLVAVYSAPYKNFNDVYKGLNGNDSMKIEYYVMSEHFEQAKIDFADHVDMVETLSKLFGEYPFIKEKYGVAEFLWNYGAMENQTITGIGYAFIGGNDFFKDTYVHELSHHWWGNSVGPKTWNDIWLNEGFATYSEALYAEAKHGKDALKSKMQSKFNDDFRGTLYAPKDLFGETVYDKGGWVLHMLRYELGDTSFFKSLRSYYSLYKYSNASVEDFKAVCENVSGINLDKFFDQWVYTGTNIIFCSYTLSFPSDNNKKNCVVNLYQEPQDYKEFHFPLEIEFHFEDSTSIVEKVFVDNLNKTFEFKLDKDVAAITIDPDSKLLATFEKTYTH